MGVRALDGSTSAHDAASDGAVRDAGTRGADVFSLPLAEASSGYYSPPAADAARFDGCTPRPCDAGQLCVNRVQGTFELSAVCSPIPSTCAPLTCLCVVEAAQWCADPACTDDGGMILTCQASARP